MSEIVGSGDTHTVAPGREFFCGNGERGRGFFGRIRLACFGDGRRGVNFFPGFQSRAVVEGSYCIVILFTFCGFRFDEAENFDEHIARSRGISADGAEYGNVRSCGALLVCGNVEQDGGVSEPNEVFPNKGFAVVVDDFGGNAKVPCRVIFAFPDFFGREVLPFVFAQAQVFAFRFPRDFECPVRGEHAVAFGNDGWRVGRFFNFPMHFCAVERRTRERFSGNNGVGALPERLRLICFPDGEFGFRAAVFLNAQRGSRGVKTVAFGF